MKTDLEVEVEVYLRQLGKVLIFRDKQTNRTFLLYIDQHHHHCNHYEAVQAGPPRPLPTLHDKGASWRAPSTHLQFLNQFSNFQF